jgi:hypothetical protein
MVQDVSNTDPIGYNPNTPAYLDLLGVYAGSKNMCNVFSSLSRAETNGRPLPSTALRELYLRCYYLTAACSLRLRSGSYSLVLLLDTAVGLD